MIAAYPRATELVWAQEEPRNMGGWTFVEPRLENLLPQFGRPRYAGRTASASPATGSYHIHKLEQAQLIEEALNSFIASFVTFELRMPVRSIARWLSTVDWTAMPKAAVDEDDQSVTWKNKIGLAFKGPITSPSDYFARSEYSNQRQFRLFIPV